MTPLSSTSSPLTERLRWGVLGAGRIAQVFCNALRFSCSSRLHAVASLDESRGQRLASRHALSPPYPRSYCSYEAMLSDAQVEAVYIANLNVDHARWAIAAARAGKHVLIEKPITLSQAELYSIHEAARLAEVTVMEGFMYRFHPQIDRVRELILSNALGEVKLIEASFGYRASSDLNDRVYRHEQGGGAIWDVGCYATSIVQWVARLTRERGDQRLSKVTGAGVVGPSGVDLHAVGSLSFSGGLLAQVTASLVADLPSRVVISGTKGHISLLDPWLPSTLCRFTDELLPQESCFPSSQIRLTSYTGGDRVDEVISIEADRDLFSYQIDAFADALPYAEHPRMSWADSLENLQMLELWRASIFSEGTTQEAHIT